MLFKRILPPEFLKNIIECYWIAENSDPSPTEQKIIPDGFTELIFHYGDPYLIRLKTSWALQGSCLLAGQISRFFYLQNTGVSGMIGVKFRPAALTSLFKIPMQFLTDKVVNLSAIPQIPVGVLHKQLTRNIGHEEKISVLNEYFGTLDPKYEDTIADQVIKLIFRENGMLSVHDITTTLFVSERQLQRVFKHYIGLTPKYYCRIIRFNYIFQCLQKDRSTWGDVFYQAGYYDQSHFIRNFKAFTGEDPSSYGFDTNNFGNFFLKKMKV